MKFGIALTTSVSPVFREFEQKEYILEVAKFLKPQVMNPCG